MDKRIIHSVFAATAREFPQHTAVVHGTRKLSYQALDLASDRIAHQLRARGVDTGTIVGISLGSSLEYVAAVLGIMKARGIFLPLDTSLPEARLAHMLQKTRPSLLLCSSATPSQDPQTLAKERAMAHELGLTPEPESIPGLDPNLALAILAPASASAVASTLDFPLPAPDDDLYLIYTSGSTGAPKAILGHHKGLAHFMNWEAVEFSLGSELRVSQFAPVTFDASLRDFFLPLTRGGSVHIPLPQERANAAHILEWLESQQICLVHCVPSLFRLLMAEIERRPDPASALPCLRHIMLAGEPVFGRDVSRWFALVGKRIQLVNFYGASETTLIKTFYRIEEPPARPGAIVPVGHPIGNTSVLIIKGDRLCAVGEMGEIHIKTPFRTKGYYRDPELTAAAFIQNPLNPDQPDILYKTGDLGRYLPDNAVEFIGRQDSQVKVNGIRIELAEIEGALRAMPELDQAIVQPIKNHDGENTLVCYYSERSPTHAGAIRDFLAQHLPEPLLPALYIYLESFPTNINGKIDRKALPKPEELLYRAGEYEAPSGEVEEKLARIWGDILELAKVGVTSHFFHIGGHSLKATRVLARIQREFELDLSLREFMEHATVRSLGVYLCTKLNARASTSSSLVDAQPPATKISVPRLPPGGRYPLAPMQRRLWIIERLERASSESGPFNRHPESGPATHTSTEAREAVYNIPGLFAYQGKLDVSAFELAFRDLIEHHECLRTRVLEENDEPYLILDSKEQASAAFRLEQRDFSADPDPELCVMRYAETACRQAFDLAMGPLFHVAVLAMGASRHAIFFNIHHIVCDGWSLDLLAEDLSSCYLARSSGRPVELKQPEFEYKDYASWLAEQRESEITRAQLNYWLKQFEKPYLGLALPLDHPRPPVPNYRGRTLVRRLETDQVQALEAAARTQGTSLLAALLSLLALDLRWFANPDEQGGVDIVLGTPVSGRNRAELERVVGLFVNTLALRLDANPNQPFEELLARVGHSLIEAQDHQDLPFDRLVEALNLPRDLSKPPLVEVMLVFQDAADQGKGVQKLGFEPMHFDAGIARFDLTLEARRGSDGLELGWCYDADLFEETTIARIASRFEALLDAAIAAPSARLAAVLPASERRELLTSFRGPEVNEPMTTLSEWFTQTATDFAHHTALVSGETRLSYRELDLQVAQISAFLRKQNLAAEQVVAIYCDRNQAWISALLAVNRAGGAFLTIPAKTPARRAAYMLDQADCRLVLADETLLESARNLPTTGIRPEIWSIQAAIQAESTLATSKNIVAHSDNHHAAILPDQLAYLLFTSGSTGEPKGVMTSHRAFVNMIRDQIRFFPAYPSSRILQFASSTFDASLSELFMALLSGAALVIADDAVIADPHELTALLEREAVSVATLPPSYLNAIGVERLPRLPELRSLVTAGEAAIPQDAVIAARHLRYINAYGPSECAVCASMFHLVEGRGPIPIGRPTANSAILILDESMQLVPIGVPGELYIEGPGLARGYLARPDLSAARFVPHPFKQGERLYATGDWGKWRDDGNLLFLGRRDNQIKLRGHRIELDEIRKRMLDLPGIENAVVCLKGDDKRMVGYYLAHQPMRAEILLAELREFLPEYMLPTQLVQLDQLPLTAHGKVDESALPDPLPLAAGTERAEATNPLEAQILDIWRRVLAQPELGTGNDFFHMGGNSLGAIRLCSQLSLGLGLRVTPRHLFQHPTVAAMAAHLEAQLASAPELQASVETRAPAQAPKPSHLQLERGSLSQQICEGRLLPLDSAAFVYLPDELVDKLVEGSGLSREHIRRDWCGGEPMLSDLLSGPFGRIGLILLPLFASELHQETERLQKFGTQALRLAAELGAGSVSLTGQLPWASDQGRLFETLSSPPILSAFPTIAASMCLSAARLLRESGRDFRQERVALVGLGLNGSLALRLMVKILGAPAAIQLQDPYPNPRAAAELALALASESAYTGPLHTNFSGELLPDELYANATFLITTVNLPGLIRTESLRPGTLVLQESGQRCLDTTAVAARLEMHADILFGEGDLISTPQPITRLLHLPEEAERTMREAGLDRFIGHQPHLITGCILSSRIGAQLPHCETDALEGALAHYAALLEQGYSAAPLHCEDYILAPEAIAAFRKRGFTP